METTTGVGVLVPDDGIEDFVREAAGLPERLDDNPNPRQPRQNGGKNVDPTRETDPDDVEPPDDDEADQATAKAAKKRLGIIE